jgi:SAM-dependent methyltransferase
MGSLEVPACYILYSYEEVDVANQAARSMGLAPHPVPSKAWDNLLALEVVKQLGTPANEPIADLGCRSGILLTWLDQLGYRNLYGCDLRRPFPPVRMALRQGKWLTVSAGSLMYIRHRSRLRIAPVEDTGLPPGLFSVVTSMSVIEHGVDPASFFAEAARLLRPGGVLVISTDYWPSSIDVGSLRRFAVSHGRDRVFDRTGVDELWAIARDAGFAVPTGPVPEAGEPVVRSAGFEYTFLLMSFRLRDDLRRSVLSLPRADAP